jgi:hypothetical protein
MGGSWFDVSNPDPLTLDVDARELASGSCMVSRQIYSMALDFLRFERSYKEQKGVLQGTIFVIAIFFL